jgi:FtsP/CotA-like multicopper oxidase with cupredoxin domain
MIRDAFIMLIRLNIFRPRTLCSFLCFGIFVPGVLAQVQAKPSPRPDGSPCPRPAAGSTVSEPIDLRSEKGVLRVELAFQTFADPDGLTRYCYTYKDGTQSPNLRLHPGDTLILALKNLASLPSGPAGKNSSHVGMSTNPAAEKPPGDPCAGGVMTSASTNVHFHGMVVPPVCYQDETIKTVIQPDSPPFEYRIHIPKSESPGLYWYHPHPHGFSEKQVLGGASGALIVEGMEKANHAVAGLPERILIIRDQAIPHGSFPAIAEPNKPTKDVSVNYIPVPYPKFPPAVIETRPVQKEFWRVLNASADTFLDLALLFDGKAQSLGLIALDGVAIGFDEGNAQDRVVWSTEVLVPPAGRAEFIVTTPPPGLDARFVTHAVERGPLFDPDRRLAPGSLVTPPGQPDQDDNDPARPLAVIRVSQDAPQTRSFLPLSPKQLLSSTVTSLASTRPIRTRKFYFSEELVDPQNPRGATRFFITEEGHTPKVFDPTAPPDVVVYNGDVEDWVIENRTNEPHTFHIHQTHFLAVGRTGGTWEELTLRDTVNIPYWNGFTRPYPSVKLRMDFRDPNIIGTFPYHCHILQHEDGGMMGSIRVEPSVKKE